MLTYSQIVIHVTKLYFLYMKPTNCGAPCYRVTVKFFLVILQMRFLYHKFDFVISQSSRDFVVLQNRIFDITKLIHDISQNRFCDNKSARFCDIRKSI